MSSFRYLCGCDPDLVGQFFERGVLVCPHHRAPVAAPENPGPQAWRGRAVVELELETVDHEDATLLVSDICDAILQDDRVHAVTSSVTALA